MEEFLNIDQLKKIVRYSNEIRRMLENVPGVNPDRLMINAGRPKKQRRSRSEIPMVPWNDNLFLTLEQMETLPLDWYRLKRCAKYTFGKLVIEGIFKDCRFQNISIKANSGKYWDGEKWVSINTAKCNEILKQVARMVEEVFFYAVKKVRPLVKVDFLPRLKTIEKMTRFEGPTKLKDNTKAHIIVNIAEVVRNNVHCLDAETRFSNRILKDEFENVKKTEKVHHSSCYDKKTVTVV